MILLFWVTIEQCLDIRNPFPLMCMNMNWQSLAWWYRSVFLTLGRQRKEDLYIKANYMYDEF